MSEQQNKSPTNQSKQQNTPSQTNQPTQKKLLAKKNVPFMYSINKLLWSQTYRQAKKYTSRSVSTFQQMGEWTPPTLGVTSSWLFMTSAVPPGSSTREAFSHIENRKFLAQPLKDTKTYKKAAIDSGDIEVYALGTQKFTLRCSYLSPPRTFWDSSENELRHG